MYPERRRAQVILYYFSFLQRDCENLTLYNVVFPFSEWISTPQLKVNKSKSAEEISNTRFGFYQLLSKEKKKKRKRWGKCLRLTWLLFSNPVPPETREHKCLLMEQCSSLQWRGLSVLKAFCSIVSEYWRVGFVPMFWLDFYFVFLKSLEISLLHSTVVRSDLVPLQKIEKDIKSCLHSRIIPPFWRFLNSLLQ